MPNELTYAERKRLELTRALATSPKLLFLDEVASGLNNVEITEFIGIIEKIRKLGITMIVVEHVMEFIMSISDRIMVLNFGEKIADGIPEEVTNDSRVLECYLGSDENE
jgi:branched-chain amino acid transport system ATP-binding protein